MRRVAFAQIRRAVAYQAHVCRAHVSLRAEVAVGASKYAFFSIPVFGYWAVANVFV